MSMIRTDGLTKRYGSVTALDSLTLEVTPGITGLVGANGAGKSTLLKIVLGLVLLDEPTNGLDPAGRDDMLGLIQRIDSEFGISVIVTSHLLGELERVCDTIVVIEAGRLTRHSSTASVTAETALVTVEVDG